MPTSIDDLVSKTVLLIEKVTDLTDVMSVQTDEIKQVRSDLNKKASQASVRAASQVMIVTVLVAMIVAGLASYGFSTARTHEERADRNKVGLEGCISTNAKNQINIDTYRNFAKEAPVGSKIFKLLNGAADRLATQNRDCANIYPQESK